MREYLTFIFIALVLILLGYITRKKGFNKLTIKRYIDQEAVVEGEEFVITTIIENNKRLPISYLCVDEEFPKELPKTFDENIPSKSNMKLHYTARYSVLWFERIKISNRHKGVKRGTYNIRNISLTIGDIFGFSSISADIEDSVDMLVYPKILNYKQLNFESSNIQGDNIVKRWIFKDPLYIRGIREYNVEDRMKDIHWKSSLKMSKLMVKDYDFTSEREIIFIVDVQGGEPHWAFVDEEKVDNIVKIAASLSYETIKEGIATGMWTNALIIGHNNDFQDKIKPSLNSFQKIMELSARINYFPKKEFHNFLKERIQEFNNNATYFVITGFLNSESVNTLAKLAKVGVLIRIIDVSKNGTVPNIPGVEKVIYRGEY